MLTFTFSLLSLAAASALATPITFSVFPGADNTLGTGDDVAVNAGSGNGTGVFFTNQFAHLSGGVGFLVDSPVDGDPLSGYINMGAIVSLSGNNVLVTARPDAGARQFGFGDVRYRFVQSSDGSTSTGVSSVDFDFVTGVDTGAVDTAKFYDLNNNLLGTLSYIDGTGNNHISYANAAGIARVDVNTSFSAATDNVSWGTEVVPEPSTLALLLSGITLIGWRQRRRE